MSETMQIVLLLSLCGTLTAMGLAALRRLLKGKLPHALFYYLWLLVLLRFLVPVALPLPAELRPHQKQAVPAPDTQLEWNSDLIAAIQQAQNQLPPGTVDDQWELVVPSGTAPDAIRPVEPAPVPASKPMHLRLWAFLCDHFLLIWLAGAGVHFLWFAFSYLRFCYGLKRDSQPLQEHEQALLDNLRGKHAVAACRSPLAATPMLVGLPYHRIVLPDTPITTRQLEYILRHELTHLRRRDLWFKWFTVAATSFHWFNPMIPWLRREIARCCELSCDEAVIGTLDAQQKQWYGETLLALAALHALPRAVPATTLCEEKTQLRERLVSIMHYRKATAVILLLSCLLALLIAGCAAVLGPQKPVVEEPDTPVAETKAPWVPEAATDASVYHWLYWGDRSEMDMIIEHDGVKSYHYSGAALQEEALTKAQQKQSFKSGILTVGEMETYKSIVDRWISQQLPLANDNYHVVYVTDPDNQHYYLAESQGVWNLSLADHTVQPAAGDWEQGNYQGCFAVYDDSYLPAGEDKRFWTLLPNDGSIPVTGALADSEQLQSFMAAWLENQYPDHTVLSSWSDGSLTVLLAGVTNPGSEGYQMLKAYVVQNGDSPAILAEKEGEPNLSVGFSAHILMAEGMTILFGDTADSLFDYQNDARIPMNFTSVRVFLANEQKENYPITGDSPYLVVMNGEKQIEKLIFLSNQGGYLYSDFYSRPLIPFTGKVAVLTQDAPLENASVETVDEQGNTILMDMALTLKKGTLVYVESHEVSTCTVTLLAGEPPHPRGQLSAKLLSTDPELLAQAGQVILNNVPTYAAAGGETPRENRSGVANVELRNALWWKVSLPGGGEPFWVKQTDLDWEWPIPTSSAPEHPSDGDLKELPPSEGSGGNPQEAELIYETRPDGSVGERFILLRCGGYMGLLDGEGNEILAPETYQLDNILLSTYEEVWPIIPVVKDGLYGAIDYKGNLVIEPAWQEVMMYCYDLPDTVFLRSGYQWYGLHLTYKSYTDVFTYTQMQVSEPFEALHLIPELQIKTAAWLEQEFHRVYDPHYDIQELIISDWDQENGREATFRYTMNYLYYNRDPDIVPYILEAKEKNPSSYETLYNDYLARKTSNYSFKIRWDGDTPTLYSDISIKGEPEWTPTGIDDYILPWNESEDTHKVFGGILWNVYLKGELPDGRKVEWNSTEEAGKNHFAVADIDGDGREELLLSWTNASTAGNDFLIYGCWRGAVYTQFDQFTSLRFYDNGAIEVDWSHSQGWSGRFWPYYAYRYNTVTDLYEEVGSAEAWDKNVRSKAFPDDIDVDGDGLVYEVCRTGVDLFNSKHYDRRRLMDGPAFEEWRQSYLSGAQEVSVELLPLTEENIAVLGVPKPDLPERQPVG